MSEILVIMPPEWVKQDMDDIARRTGYSMTYMHAAAGQPQHDLNDRLAASGDYFTSDLRVQDVLVMNEQVYFRFELQ